VAGGAGVRPAWARGRNFDASQLEFYTAEPGFILGEAILGEDSLGGAGPDELLPATFTSLNINSPTTVEDGMFVHRELETCQLSATLPEAMDLRLRWFAVKYGTVEVYRGRIAQVKLSESVEVNAEYKPGNTAVKTHRISLVAANGEENLAGMSTPPRDFTSETLAQRITSWTGLGVTVESPAVDLPLNWSNAAWDTATVRKVYFAADRLGSLLDTLRAEARLRNMTFKYQPLEAQPFVLKPNNQWLTGATEADALTFSDDPGHTEGQATDAGDQFTHLGRYVGYARRDVGEDVSLFTNAVTLRWGQYDLESPPVDGNPVEFRQGPYRASGASARDVVVDVGTLDIASPGTNPYWFTRAVIGTLPLKAAPVPFTQALSGPLQSTQQLEGTVPGMALLEHDGIIERVAVLGREHEVTPDRWTVRYTLGPPHLLDRLSDFDPGTPEVHPQTGTSGSWDLEWLVPPYPSDATIYEVQFSLPTSTRLITSDKADLGIPDVVLAPAPGTVRTKHLSGSSGDGFWVLYTSNPAPASVNVSPEWREGQPGYIGTAL
jgi:hypothetical protein